MSAFSSFVTAFCTVSVLLAALSLLRPKQPFSGPMRYLLSLAFLGVILSASVGSSALSFRWPQTADPPSLRQEAAAAAAESVFAEALTQENINFSKITVCTDKTADGGIIIIEVTVVSAADPERIRQVIGSAGAYEVRVIRDG